MPIRIQGTPWHKEVQVLLQETKRQAFVCLTHIVPSTVDLLLQNLPPQVRLRALVRLDQITLHDESLKALLERPNTELGILKNLNSKLYILDGEVAVLFAANPTLEGLESNVGFDVVVDDRKASSEILSRLEEYWKKALMVKDAGVVAQARKKAVGEWVDPVRTKAIEFLSYEDMLVDKVRSKIAENPEDAASHRRLGDLLRMQGDRSEAMTSYHRALQLQPDLSDARLSLARCLWETGEPEKCLEEVFEVLRQDKGNAEAYQLSALIYERRGDERMAQAARQEYERLSGSKAAGQP